jgi:hypothetical protein
VNSWVCDSRLVAEVLFGPVHKQPPGWKVISGGTIKNALTDSHHGSLHGSDLRISLRKEVIQPQVPLRLPCYDFVPVTDLTVDIPELVRLRVLPAPMT